MMDDLLQPFLDRPETAGIFSDFDGTLSEIVPIPSDARPIPGAREILTALARRFGLVGIISGRSASQLVEWLGTTVQIWGVHGAEHTRDGEVVLSDRAAPFAELIQRVREDAERLVASAGIPGALVEDKGVLLALHYRAAEDTERARAALDRIATELAERYELQRGEGRQVFELRPPIRFSKGDVILERVQRLNLQAAMFIGDDAVDLPAFDALDRLSELGLLVLRVAVLSLEAPDELIERADRVVEGPDGALAFLSALVY